MVTGWIRYPNVIHTPSRPVFVEPARGSGLLLFSNLLTSDENCNHALTGQLIPSAHVPSPAFTCTAATSADALSEPPEAPGAAGPCEHKHHARL